MSRIKDQFLFLFLMLPIFIFGGNDLQTIQLKGKVKSTTVVWRIAYDQQKKGSLYKKEVTTYNADGNFTKRISTDYSPELPDGKRDITQEFKYDSLGNQVEQDYYTQTVDSGKWKDMYTGKFTKKYDRLGNKTEEDYYDDRGNLFSKNIYKYDSLGRCVEMKTFMGHPLVYQEKSVFQYDANSNEYLQKGYTKQGKVSFSDTTNYNDKGFKSEYIQNAKGAGYELHKKYIYESYDSIGNWTKMTEYDFDMPDFIKEQTIEYY